MAVPGVKFIYLWCTDLDAMRRFYTELVGLHEVYHSAAEGSVGYDCDGLQFSITRDEAAPALPAGWANQPGWDGGNQPAPSWSVSLTADTFAAAVERLQAAGVPTVWERPEWVGSWSYPVRDPMGNTVEITWAPE